MAAWLRKAGDDVQSKAAVATKTPFIAAMQSRGIDLATTPSVAMEGIGVLSVRIFRSQAFVE
ncbi:hypothetical protein ACFSC3_00505 [Sphingomonas floccifaciens]|uniref:Uncharacterized protein n=1 Tax=Sphingomonas floccifaciens TaxID=1844115 RepID=A0ABW4N7C7_9SPHN